MTPTQDTATLAFYAAEAARYVAVRPDEPYPPLTAFLDRLTPGASILELGCGGGIDAAHMIAAGFDVEPTDGVREMAAQAEGRLGRPVRVMRFDELGAVNRYDAVVANASLLHVPMAGLTPILQRIWRALVPGGWHFASYKTGDGEGIDSFGRYYNRPDASQLDDAYRSAGSWQTCALTPSFEEGCFGAASDWLTVVARKPC